MPILEVTNISVKYGRTQVLWDVSLRIEECEIVALIGANAAGKSTLLKTISGLLRPISGSIEFLGKRIDSWPAHEIVEAGVCHIPEGRRLFPEMTVHENLDLGAYVRRAWAGRGRTVEEMYELFPILKERKKQLAKSLSGGQQQMVAIARGLMSQPKIVMLDEPSHGLSPIMVSEVFDIVKRLQEHSCTVLLVEQNVQRSLEIADRAYVLENGRVVLEGEGRQLVENPHIREAYLGL